MKCEAPRAPRSSPAHLVYKFGGAVQEILNLATQLDAKTLSDKRTARLRERIHDLDSALWPDDPHGATKATDAQNDAALADAQAKIKQLQDELRTARAAERDAPADSSRGSLLDRIVIRPKEPATRRSYENLFARYFPGVTKMTIYEPYLSNLHQVLNLSDFLEMAISASNGLLNTAVIYTSESSRTQQERLSQLASRAADLGRCLEIHYMPRLHNREIVLSNGVVIASDRGLDLYEAPPLGYRRQPAELLARVCRNGVIDIFSREVSSTQPNAMKAKIPSPGRGRRVTANPKLARVATEGSKTLKRTTDGNMKQPKFNHDGPSKTASEDAASSPMRQPEFEQEDDKVGKMQQSVFLQNNDDEDIEMHDSRIDEERASMMREHVAALARERYEELHDPENELKNEEIRQESQRLVVWDLRIRDQNQYFHWERYVGDMQENGIIHYFEAPYGDEPLVERMISIDDPMSSE